MVPVTVLGWFGVLGKGIWLSSLTLQCLCGQLVSGGAGVSMVSL